VRDTGNGRVTADFVLPAGRFQNAVLRFRQTSGGVRNVRLLRPGYSLTNTPTFTDAYKQMLGPFGVLRFMGPLNTNSAPAYPSVTAWSSARCPRRTRTAAGRGRGIAWEYVTQLATETGKDVWINVPIAANDDYVTNLAAFLRDRLPPTAKVYVEYSNEVWNGGFAQAAWNRSAAIAEVSGEGPFDQNVGDWRDDPNNQTYWGHKRVARRLIQVSRIFRQAFGETGLSVQSPAARVRPVLASQTGNPYVLDLQLLYTERYFGPPSDYFYGVAGAPYFALGGIASSTSLTVDQILNQFRASIDGGVRTGMRSFTTMASFYGLRSLVYEGGPDDVASSSDPVGFSQQAKYDAQYDPRMAGIVGDYLRTWGAVGGDLFMYFGDCSGFTRYGPWGLTEDPGQLDVPKYTGLLSFMAGAQPPMTDGTRLSSDGPAFTAAPEFADSIGGRATVNTAAATPYLSGITPITHFDYLLNVAETGIYRVSVEALTANANITEGPSRCGSAGRTPAPATAASQRAPTGWCRGTRPPRPGPPRPRCP
jgi:hypothetical protein